MKFNRFAAILLSGVALGASVSAAAQEAPQNPDGGGFNDIVVTARRQAENIQSVPVAVSVVSDALMKSTGTFRPEDIASSVPGLAISGGGDTDRTNIIFTIRGQGFTYGTLFPAVVTYFNEVPVKFLAAGQFYDSESLQVLRGPQGVQFGRVTDGGNVMLTPKRPTDQFGADVTVKGGTYNLLGTTGFINLPVAGDKLMVRVAWDVARRDGFTHNITTGKDLDNVNYQGARIGVLWKPSDAFENYTVAQYQYIDDNGTGFFHDYENNAAVSRAVGSLFPLVTTASEFGLGDPAYGIAANGRIKPWVAGMTPLTEANYIAAIQAGITRQHALGNRTVALDQPQFNKRNFLYITNTSTFNISDNVSLKNVFGYTWTKEISGQHYVGDNTALVASCHSACPFPGSSMMPFSNQQQLSEELRLSGKSLGNRLTWSIGGYMDEQKPHGIAENDTTFAGILEYTIVQRAKTKSRAAYAYAEYDVTDKFKVNGGIRYTHDTVDSENATYNALLPAPGLASALATNIGLFRSFGVPAFASLTDAQIAGLAATTANSAYNLPHGQCTTFNGGLFQGSCTRTSGAFNSTTWTAGASYQFTPHQLAYVKVSKGYRPGGVNFNPPAGYLQFSAYKPETDLSIEGGIKADWELGTVPVRTNLAVYRDRYKGIQQTITVPDSSGNPGSLVLNVAAAKIWGIEFEGSIRPAPGFTIGVNYSYTDAKFDTDGQTLADVTKPGTPTYLACNATIPVNFGFCTFNRFPSTPKHQLGVNAHWDFIQDDRIGTIGIGGNWYYQSDSALANSADSFLSPRGIEPSYSTFNLNMNWNRIYGSRFDLGLFLTNVTNEVHRVIVNANEHVSSLGNITNIYSPPRMFGGSVTAHF